MTSQSNTELQYAHRILEDLAAARSGETALLVVDHSSSLPVADAIETALGEIGTNVTRIPTNDFLAGSFARGTIQLVVSLAEPLLTHVDTMREELRAGGRYLNLRGLTPDFMEIAGKTDFIEMTRLGDEWAKALEEAKWVRIEDANGTDLVFTPGGPGLNLDGRATVPGKIGGFPAGEVAMVPVIESVEGIWCRPVHVEGHKELNPDVNLTFKAGRLVEISDTPAGNILRDRLAGVVESGIPGEFGLGTNPLLHAETARTSKKAFGMAHFGIGDNQTFGGDVVAPAHIDIILETPTVTTDSGVILLNGARP